MNPVRQWTDNRGAALLLREVRAQDAAGLNDLLMSLSFSDRRWRFHGAVKGFTPATLRRLAEIDVERELAFVVLEAGDAGGGVLAEVRCVLDDAGGGAEFAIAVHPRWRRRGIGLGCMRVLAQAAARRGLRCLHGEVCAYNCAMLALAAHCGFARCTSRNDASLIEVELPLTAANAAPTWRSARASGG